MSDTFSRVEVITGVARRRLPPAMTLKQLHAAVKDRLARMPTAADQPQPEPNRGSQLTLTGPRPNALG
jgi:hypothetical protein